MAEFQSVAGTTNQGLETIGEYLEDSGQSVSAKALQQPAVRKRISRLVGNHPYWAAGIALAGIGAYLYFRE